MEWADNWIGSSNDVQGLQAGGQPAFYLVIHSKYLGTYFKDPSGWFIFQGLCVQQSLFNCMSVMAYLGALLSFFQNLQPPSDHLLVTVHGGPYVLRLDPHRHWAVTCYC